MATNSNILAWRIPWTEEPGGLQSCQWGPKESDMTEQLNTHIHTPSNNTQCNRKENLETDISQYGLSIRA